MDQARRLIREIHRRSLWQVLGIYLVGGWIAFEVVQTLTEGLGLPGWFPALALVLLIVGLPVVLATAFVQEGVGGGGGAGGGAERANASEARKSGSAARSRSARPAAVRRILTWRNALTAGVVAFALWGAVAAGWVLIRGPAMGSAAVEGSTVPPSIAVLPLQNIGGSQEDRYFAEGVTEDITLQLSKISGLDVRSRTSAMRYQDPSDKLVSQIAEELGVQYILEGSVRRADDDVRVVVQLIDARRDQHVWGEEYQRRLRDIFALQGDISRQVAEALETRLTPEESLRIARSPTENLAAYDLYNQGRHYWRQRGDENLRRAIEYFQAALDEDPAFAQAYAALAETYAVLPGWIDPQSADIDSSYIRTERYARRALALDSTLAQANAALGLAAIREFEWNGADKAFARALALDPNYAYAHFWYAVYFAAMREIDLLLEHGDRALELEPSSRHLHGSVALLYGVAGQYDEAIAICEHAVGPSGRVAQLGGPCPGRNLALIASGRYDELLRTLRPAHLPDDPAMRDLVVPTQTLALAMAYAGMGEEEEALGLIEEVVASGAGDTHAPWVALAYTRLGRTDDAFHWLERGYAANVQFIRLMNVNPLFEPLRSDPRFDELLRKMNLAP